MKIKIHTQGIKGSGSIQDGEDADVLFNGVLEVDGLLIDRLGKIQVIASGSEMAVVTVDLFPGSIEVVTHTKESWPELLARMEEGAVAA